MPVSRLVTQAFAKPRLRTNISSAAGRPAAAGAGVAQVEHNPLRLGSGFEPRPLQYYQRLGSDSRSGRSGDSNHIATMRDLWRCCSWPMVVGIPARATAEASAAAPRTAAARSAHPRVRWSPCARSRGAGRLVLLEAAAAWGSLAAEKESALSGPLRRPAPSGVAGPAPVRGGAPGRAAAV